MLPLFNSALQAPGQVMPGEVLVTVPGPVPDLGHGQRLPRAGGAEGVESAPCSVTGGPFGAGNDDARAVAAGHVDLAVGRGRGFVDGDPDRRAVDDRVFELAAEERLPALNSLIAAPGVRSRAVVLSTTKRWPLLWSTARLESVERDEAPRGGVGAVDVLDRGGQARRRVIDLDGVVGGVGDVDVAFGGREGGDRDAVAVARAPPVPGRFRRSAPRPGRPGRRRRRPRCGGRRRGRCGRGSTAMPVAGPASITPVAQRWRPPPWQSLT